jgi:hypothetical protein
MGTSSVNGSFNWRIYENPILELWFAGKIIKLNVWLSNLPCLITTWYTFLVVKLRKWCGAYDGVYNMNTSMTWRYCDENILQNRWLAVNCRAMVAMVEPSWSLRPMRQCWPLLLDWTEFNATRSVPKSNGCDFVLFELMFLGILHFRQTELAQNLLLRKCRWLDQWLCFFAKRKTRTIRVSYFCI